jgi:hypothetical protein
MPAIRTTTGDGVVDASDNCPIDANSGREDNDLDAAGDACDADDDDDGVADDADNCQYTANADQLDGDGDGAGDVCDADRDGDAVLNGVDNCPDNPNELQDDFDADAEGDVCDGDDDNDGADDGTDNCPLVANSTQIDTNGNGVGDACEPDDDGVADAGDLCPGTPAATVVDPQTGCSIAQLCPCAGPRGSTERWRNHGKYVSCVAKTAETFLGLGRITHSERDTTGSAAAQSSCGQ